MTTERRRKVESILHLAAEHAGEARRRFLDDACGEDEDLRSEVESLLHALDATTLDESAALRQALERSPGREGSDTAPPPERVGPYRLLEKIGEGGMGTVYLAEQSDPLPRRVALKLVHTSGVDGDGLRRFQLEREALARMSHRAIAQVFDAGAADDGRPYMVLEHVPGEPITDYCDARRLDLRQRVRLYLDVCDGVRHAHQKAVIHRDLKPTNILVTDVDGAPHPKIIDFGIAKALVPWSASSRPRDGAAVGSHGYMSPEELSTGGRAVDTRSDVYALGVVLSELIAGVRPLDEQPETKRGPGGRPAPARSVRPSLRLRALPDAQRRRIARRRMLRDRTLLRRIRPELDWIVLRAVAEDPAARYGSAAELAADLLRWLDGRPVEARPPSALYRAAKLVRRHAVLFSAGVVIVSTILGFSLRSRLLYARAEAARVQAEELVGFMLDDLSSQLEPMGRLDLLESVSQRSLEYFESSTEGSLEQAGPRPAAALRQIGSVLSSRGDLDAAYDAYERARRIDEERWRRPPGDPEARLDLARDLGLLGEVEEERGELHRAAARRREAETHLRRLTAESPDHFRASLALAEALNSSAATARFLGDSDQARALLDESLAIATDLVAAHPDVAAVRHALGDAHYSLGLLAFHSRGDAAAAAREFGAGVAVYRTLAASQPEASVWRYRLAVLLGQGLASVYEELDRLPEAREANREALEIFEVLVREEPSNGRWAHALGWELIRRGNLARAGGGDLETAVRAFERSVEVQEELIARTRGAHTAWLDGLASAYEALGEVHSERGDRAAALTAAEGSLAARQRISGDDGASPFFSTYLATAGVLVAELRSGSGDVEGALEALDAAIEAMARIDAEKIEEPYARLQHADTARRLEALLQSYPLRSARLAGPEPVLTPAAAAGSAAPGEPAPPPPG